jgi:hypothetical protein
MPPQEVSGMTWEEYLGQERRCYGMIAAKDGFALPRLTAATQPDKCYADWVYCRRLIEREGLYYELFD